MPPEPLRRRLIRVAVRYAAFACAAGLAACNLPPSRRWFGSPPPASRNTSVSPASAPTAGSAARPLVVVADFDSITHSAFSVVPASEGTSIGLRASGGRTPTGPAMLVATLPPGAAVYAEPSAGWPVNWRPFTHFSAAVRAPSDGVVLGLEIVSGLNRELLFRTGPLALRSGWNSVLLDIRDAGAQMDLDHVAGMYFRVVQATGLVELGLDDLVLADDHEDILGSPRAPFGTLYLQRYGPQFVAGVTGHYEVVFEAGRIVRCFDLAGDRNRVASLCLRGPLGPVPLSVRRQDIRAGNALSIDLDAFPGSDPVRKAQRSIEANPLRIIIEGVWMREPPASAGSASQPSTPPQYRWRYVLDRHGRINVTVLGAGMDEIEIPPMAVFLDSADAARWEFDVINPPGGGGRFGRAAARGGSGWTPASRDSAANSRLLWIVPQFVGPVAFNNLRCLGSSLRAAVFADDRRADGPWTRSSLILVAPYVLSDLDDPRSLWADVVNPAPAGVDADVAFEPRQGCYCISLRGRRARLNLGADGIHRYAPLLEIRGTRGHDVVATCNGHIVPAHTRSADGNVLIELPTILRSSTIEIFVP